MSRISNFADVVCAFRPAVRFVMAFNAMLLVLSAFSVGTVRLSSASRIVLWLSVVINVASFLVAVGVLVLCRRHTQ